MISLKDNDERDYLQIKNQMDAIDQAKQISSARKRES